MCNMHGEIMSETIKNAKIFESDFNTLTLIARKEDKLHESGPQKGKANVPEVLHLIIEKYAKVCHVN